MEKYKVLFHVDTNFFSNFYFNMRLEQRGSLVLVIYAWLQCSILYKYVCYEQKQSVCYFVQIKCNIPSNDIITEKLHWYLNNYNVTEEIIIHFSISFILFIILVSVL